MIFFNFNIYNYNLFWAIENTPLQKTNKRISTSKGKAGNVFGIINVNRKYNTFI